METEFSITIFTTTFPCTLSLPTSNPHPLFLQHSFFVSISFNVNVQSVLRQLRSLFHSEFPTECSTSFFNYQHTFFSLRSSSSCYFVFLVFPSLLSFPPSFLQWRGFKSSFYAKYDQSSLYSFYLSYVAYLCSWHYVILLHFSKDLSKWSSPTFSNTAFQNFPGVFDLLLKRPYFTPIQSWLQM